MVTTFIVVINHNVYKYKITMLYPWNIILYVNDTSINFFLKRGRRTSLVVQCLRIRLPMQGTWVWFLVQEDPTCRGATKPVYHNYWACTLEPARRNYWSSRALEPANHNYWAHAPQLLKPACSRACVPQLWRLRAATTEARVPRAHTLQQEKPPQWEVPAPQRRVAPVRLN